MERSGRRGRASTSMCQSLLGRAVQVVPIKPTLKPLEIKRLKLNSDELVSNFALKFNSCRYTLGPTPTLRANETEFSFLDAITIETALLKCEVGSGSHFTLNPRPLTLDLKS